MAVCGVAARFLGGDQADGGDPALWALAAAGEQLVGAVTNRIQTGDAGELGWLDDVAVDPAWRRQGLWLALVYQSFRQFYQRGVRRCGLSVDIANASGASRLYERAGT